ncbi:MAG: hypothetical protein ACU85V_19340, partial [Gammaproteobacteria bacterium]
MASMRLIGRSAERLGNTGGGGARFGGGGARLGGGTSAGAGSVTDALPGVTAACVEGGAGGTLSKGLGSG